MLVQCTTAHCWIVGRVVDSSVKHGGKTCTTRAVPYSEPVPVGTLAHAGANAHAMQQLVQQNRVQIVAPTRVARVRIGVRACPVPTVGYLGINAQSNVNVVVLCEEERRDPDWHRFLPQIHGARRVPQDLLTNQFVVVGNVNIGREGQVADLGERLPDSSHRLLQIWCVRVGSGIGMSLQLVPRNIKSRQEPTRNTHLHL